MKKKKDPEIAPQFLDKSQLAQMFSVSTKTVERMFADGLDSFKVRGKRYVTQKQLDDYISRNKTA